MKATFRQGAAATARGGSARLRPPSLSSSAPPVDTARAKLPAGEDRDASRLWDACGDMVVAVAAWLVLLGLALSALSAVVPPTRAAAPTAMSPSADVARSVSEMDPRPLGLGAEFTP